MMSLSMIMRFVCCLFLTWIALTGLPKRSSAADSNAAETPRPNVLIIIADDLGYGETGMMGNTQIPTPGIDRLAATGVRCTQGYVTSSYCSPSRAGLMTGRYQSRFGYDINPTGKRNLHPRAGLPSDEPTFVARLAEAGYHTGLFGKWHLGSQPSMQPTARGFEQFFGFLHEGHYYVAGPPYQNVLTMIRDKSLPTGSRRREGNLIRGNYAPINEPEYDADNPLLQGTTGQPLQPATTQDYLTDAITDQAVAFLRSHQKSNHPSANPFCAVVAYNAVHSPMQASQEDFQHPAVQAIQDIQRQIFAGMLIALDRGVNRLLQTLDQLQVADNTLVFFLSDNGGPTAELTSSNAPLRDGKGSVYEGGVRVPFVFRLPGICPPGTVEDRPVLSLDIAATCLDLAGLPVPDSMDGKSLRRLRQPDNEDSHEQLFWRMQRGKAAMRQGKWKIVCPGRKGRSPRVWQLYDLEHDLSETNDLSAANQQRTQAMISAWEAWDAEMATPIRLQ